MKSGSRDRTHKSLTMSNIDSPNNADTVPKRNLTYTVAGQVSLPTQLIEEPTGKKEENGYIVSSLLVLSSLIVERPLVRSLPVDTSCPRLLTR
jgi:hypothetical protein